MKSVDLRLLALCSLSLAGACDDTGAGPNGPEVAIEVAPLTLPNVLGVQYALAVFNGDPAPYNTIFDGTGTVVGSTSELVWQQGSVTSNQYGNNGGGDISYVGPCDASVTTDNYVALALRQVNVGTGGSLDGIGPFFTTAGAKNVLDDEVSVTDTDADFINPCDWKDPCVLHFPCLENRDVSVVFNLTIMRDANQGFFDIAVNFEDVFCSAKFETCYDVTTTANTTSIPRVKQFLINNNGTTAQESFHEYYFGKAYYAQRVGTDTYWNMYSVDRVAQAETYAKTKLFEFTNNSDTPLASVTDTNTYVLQMDATTTYPQSGGTRIKLLYGPTAGGPREDTAIAAIACTVGADSTTPPGNVETELLMTQPTVVCDGGQTFALPIGGQDQGNRSFTNANAKTIYYALYFGKEDLNCGQGTGSCNKVYYNIAINTQQLALAGLTNCVLGYGATAKTVGDVSTFDVNGNLVDTAAQYGVIKFGSATAGLPLTAGAGVTSCNSNPLGPSWSLVQPGFIKGIDYGGGAFPGFDFHSAGAIAVTYP